MLGDSRSLEQMIVDLARQGVITSFCTAGYRCGRTGGCIMDALKTGKEGTFCKINAERELAAIAEQYPVFYPQVKKRYDRICAGERDLYF